MTCAFVVTLGVGGRNRSSARGGFRLERKLKKGAMLPGLGSFKGSVEGIGKQKKESWKAKVGRPNGFIGFSGAWISAVAGRLYC
jgi:hypothetical protein